MRDIAMIPPNLWYSYDMAKAEVATFVLPQNPIPTISLSLTATEETVATFDDFDLFDEDDDEDYCCEDCEAQEKENTMSYDTPKFRDTAEGKRVEYLNDRASTLFYTKDEALQQQFGLRDDEYPQTAEELVKRIQDGKFVIREKSSNTIFYEGGALARLQFRAPDLKRDDAGYSLAYQKLRALLQDTKDAIMIKSADEGLAAVKAFGTATIQ